MKPEITSYIIFHGSSFVHLFTYNSFWQDRAKFMNHMTNSTPNRYAILYFWYWNPSSIRNLFLFYVTLMTKLVVMERRKQMKKR